MEDLSKIPKMHFGKIEGGKNPKNQEIPGPLFSKSALLEARMPRDPGPVREKPHVKPRKTQQNTQIHESMYKLPRARESSLRAERRKRPSSRNERHTAVYEYLRPSLGGDEQ